MLKLATLGIDSRIFNFSLFQDSCIVYGGLSEKSGADYRLYIQSLFKSDDGFEPLNVKSYKIGLHRKHALQTLGRHLGVINQWDPISSEQGTAPYRAHVN